MNHLSKYIVGVMLLSLLSPMFSCANQTKTMQDEKEQLVMGVFDEEKAALNYRNHCGGCHGQNFESFIERNWLYGNSSESILNSIKVGYEQNGMPSYANSFSEQELKDLAQYILQEIDGKTKESILINNPDFSEVITSNDLDFRLETITDNISGIPWGMVQLPNGEFLVTERGGKFFRVGEDSELTEITGLPNVVSAGQGGLLDVVIHPDFENNSYIYLSYSSPNPTNSSQSTTAVVRAKLSGNNLEQTEEIFTALPYVSTTHHYGSRLLFDQEGYLYVSVGDRGYRDVYPQTLDNYIGKVHRIEDDGRIPSSNPFFNDQGAVNSVFSYGSRNPQGLALHPITGAVWEGEHGPQGGDEINILEAGKNYGWPVITYGINYNGTPITDHTEMDGMEQPIHYWVPSIAPCGMTFVSSNYYASWENDLFVGSLKFQYLHRLKMDGNVVVGHEELLKDIGRVRDVSMGNDGYIYILVENPGRLIRLVPEQ